MKLIHIKDQLPPDEKVYLAFHKILGCCFLYKVSDDEFHICFGKSSDKLEPNEDIYWWPGPVFN